MWNQFKVISSITIWCSVPVHQNSYRWGAIGDLKQIGIGHLPWGTYSHPDRNVVLCIDNILPTKIWHIPTKGRLGYGLAVTTSDCNGKISHFYTGNIWHSLHEQLLLAQIYEILLFKIVFRLSIKYIKEPVLETALMLLLRYIDYTIILWPH